MNNWNNKLDLPLDLIIMKNDELDCDYCDAQRIYYCFNCCLWHCICLHTCGVCGESSKTRLWHHFVCRCGEFACNDDKSGCIRTCYYCDQVYCRQCVHRMYAKRKDKPSTYACIYCSKHCQKCGIKATHGLSQCGQCGQNVCILCNYSSGICTECKDNLLAMSHELIKEYIKE